MYETGRQHRNPGSRKVTRQKQSAVRQDAGFEALVHNSPQVKQGGELAAMVNASPSLAVQRVFVDAVNNSMRTQQVGTKPLGQRGATADRVSTPLPEPRADAPVQRGRTKFDMGTTTGTEYDANKLTDRKTKAMAAFSELPGPVDDGKHFTWHHIVPQSHLKNKSIASESLLVRLGPSTSYRIDDPGNDWTDPNYEEDGSRTPFSEAVDDRLNKIKKLDHDLLHQRLMELINEQAPTRDAKKYGDPAQWHIALDTLSKAANLTQEEVQFLNALAKPTKYWLEDQQVTQDAVSWGDLRRKNLEKHEALFAKLDKHIRNAPKVFFRGFQIKDSVEIKRFRHTRELRARATKAFEERVNQCQDLGKSIRRNGKVLIFVKQWEKLGNDVGGALSELVKANGLGRLSGTEHDYYVGDDETELDRDSLDAVNESGTALKEAGLGTRQLVFHNLKQSKKASEQNMEAVSLPWLREEDIDVTNVPGLAWEVKLGNAKYAVLNEEEEAFVKTEKFKMSKTAYSKRWRTGWDEVSNRKKAIVDRKSVAEYNKGVIGSYKRDVLKKKKLVEFAILQNTRIAQLNEQTKRYSTYVNETGAVDAQSEAEKIENLDFLKTYWTVGWNESMAEFEKCLNAIELLRPKDVTGEDTDFSAPIELFEENARILVDDHVASLGRRVEASIEDTGRRIRDSKISQKDALTTPQPEK